MKALPRNRRRSAFTIFESMLVAGVVLIASALAYPSLNTMYDYYKLNGAIDSVRSAWANARGRAIEEGRPYRFSVEADGKHFRYAPDHSNYWSGSTPENDPAGKGLVVEDVLPGGVRFTLNGDMSSPMPMNDMMNDVGMSSTKAESKAGGDWSTAVVFLPDGTAREDVRILFQVRNVRPAMVHLRGLTGSVSVQYGE